MSTADLKALSKDANEKNLYAFFHDQPWHTVIEGYSSGFSVDIFVNAIFRPHVIRSLLRKLQDVKARAERTRVLEGFKTRVKREAMLEEKDLKRLDELIAKAADKNIKQALLKGQEEEKTRLGNSQRLLRLLDRWVKDPMQGTLKSEDNRVGLNDATDKAPRIRNVCQAISDAKGQARCYVMWKRWCPLATPHDKAVKCEEALDNAQGHAALWDFCRYMADPQVEARCYRFGAMVKGLCQMIGDAPGKSHCIVITSSLPDSVRIEQ